MAADEFEDFAAEYRRSLPEKIAEIDRVWAAIEDGSANPEQLRTLLRVLHSIAGSARTFGVEGLSEAAAAAETALEPSCERGALPAGSERGQLQKLLAAVKARASA